MDSASISPKICPNCGTTERNYRGDCKECKRIKGRAYHTKKHPPTPKIVLTPEEKAEKQNAYFAAYYQTNKARLDQMGKAWAEANRVKSREIKKKWRLENQDKQREAMKSWYARNQDRAAETRRNWNEANAEYKRILTNNRRQRLTGGKLSKDIVHKLMESQQCLCACCGKPLVEYHIDHIIPVSRGGANTDDNVQLLLPKCNMEKNALMFDEYLKRKYGGNTRVQSA